MEFRLINDPVEIRRNEYKVGAAKIRLERKISKTRQFARHRKNRNRLRGRELARRTGNSDTQGEAQINPDGSIEIRIGVQDIGTGTKTVDRGRRRGNARPAARPNYRQEWATPISPRPGQRRQCTCPSVSPVVYDICSNALQQLQAKSGIADARGDNWFSGLQNSRRHAAESHRQISDSLAGGPAYGVQFAEVEVDTETGLVTVKKIVAVHDCGLIIDHLTLESQINGGCIIGMGYALYEERVMDRMSGVVLNPNFETYKLTALPTCRKSKPSSSTCPSAESSA